MEINLPMAKIEFSEDIKELTKGLLAAQKQMGAAKKGADNPFFKSKYADLNSVLEVCKEPLNGAGIIILQPTHMDADKLVVATMLVHAESGQWIKSSMVALEAKDMQKLGSSVSYARRYTLQSLLSIPAEDDDGEKSVGRGGKAPAKQEPKENKQEQPSAGRASGFGGKR
jgi:hypothetical protein